MPVSGDRPQLAHRHLALTPVSILPVSGPELGYNSTKDQDDDDQGQTVLRQGQDAGQNADADAGQDIEGLHDQPPAGLTGTGRPTAWAFRQVSPA